MKADPQTTEVVRHLRGLYIVAALFVFVGLPLLIYSFGDFPRRSVLKEAISVTTLVAFSLMLGQFFLARSNMDVITLYSLKRVKQVHTIIAYSAVTVMLLHPALLVLPRTLEGGIDPMDAFITLITTFDNLGVVLGLVAWVLLFILVPTATFRIRIIQALKTKYPKWRYFHGGLSVALVTAAIAHAILLGRHVTWPMAATFVGVAVLGVGLLFRMYFGKEGR